MRVIFIVLFLIFSFQTLTNADDIRDFEIEGMSIGDSLLNYMTTSQIKKNQIDYGGKRKYYATKYDGDLSIYDRIEIWLKSGDENYRIYGITTGIYYEKNLSDCLAKKKIIVNDLEKLFENLKFTDNEKNHDACINLALLPLQIRGFGHVKEEAITKTDKIRSNLKAIISGELPHQKL